jgi:peroxiredoxin
MAQLRQEYSRFVANETEIVVVGPDNASAFRNYWAENDLPFTGLPDSHYSVLKLYGQEIKLFKFGRMPAQVVVDKEGIARYVHYGKSMRDIPSNDEILESLEPVHESG